MAIPVPHERLENSLPHLDYLDTSQNQNGNDYRSYAHEESSRHSRSIAFDKFGLIDVAVLLEYMDEPHCHKLSKPRDHSECKDEYHHLYFSAPFYKLAGGIYNKFRDSRYNQINIASCQEDFYHQQHEKIVPLPDPDAAVRFMEETKFVNEYAAASGGLVAAQKELNATSLSDNKAKAARIAARVALFQELAQESQQKINQIEVMPFQIITGALKNYADRTHEIGLENFVQRRLATEPSYLKTRVHNEAYIRSESEAMMKRRVDALSWTLKLIFTREPYPQPA